MSDFQTVVDAIAADLTTNVSGLDLPLKQVHKYVPWNPEVLTPDGKRHLAVYPSSDGPDTNALGEAGGPPTGSHFLQQFYEIVVWEGSKDAARQLIANEQEELDFLDLHNAIRDRLYVSSNQNLGASFRSWYGKTDFPPRSGNVRWFRILLDVVQIQEFT